MIRAPCPLPAWRSEPVEPRVESASPTSAIDLKTLAVALAAASTDTVEPPTDEASASASSSRTPPPRAAADEASAVASSGADADRPAARRGGARGAIDANPNGTVALQPAEPAETHSRASTEAKPLHDDETNPSSSGDRSRRAPEPAAAAAVAPPPAADRAPPLTAAADNAPPPPRARYVPPHLRRAAGAGLSRTQSMPTLHTTDMSALLLRDDDAATASSDAAPAAAPAEGAPLTRVATMPELVRKRVRFSHRRQVIEDTRVFPPHDEGDDEDGGGDD